MMNYANTIKKTAALLAVFLLLLLPGCGSNDSLIKVKAVEVKTGTIEGVFMVTGALVPAQTADISATMTGKVAEVNVEEGASVSEGQILAKLDDSQLSAQLSQAEATLSGSKQSLEQAKINRNNAKATLDRTKALYAEGAVSKVQLDTDQKAYDLAKSQYEASEVSGTGAAKASVDSVSVQLGNTVIKSPISGIVVNKNISIGETAAAGSTLITVADMSVLKLKGTVSQEALPYIKKNDKVELTVDIYPDQIFQGTVSQIGAMSVSAGTYFPIEISMENTQQLPSGVSAHADLKAESSNRILVPVKSVVTNNGESYLFVLEDGVAKKTSVVTGLKNDEEIEIVKGLKGGEQVAGDNANHLLDGMSVEIMKD
ncbi:MAG: efflux transporter periplasmic adaptor subunit [Bacillota bacterium]|jgi:RND family efflux transporter MFP subunit|nr:efflux transporter periplasmic adaptor subunit [Bacillota bacterium]